MFIGSAFVVVDHRGRSRRQVLERALAELVES
jgi:hypothetical protein